MILIDREDLSVVAFCFGKPAGLMMPQRRSEQFGNLKRGVAGCAGRRRNVDLPPLFGCHWSLFSLHSEGLPDRRE